MTKQLRIAVGLPHYQGKSSFEHARMWLEFGHTLACSEERFMLVAFTLLDVCGIDKARNECIAAAKQGDADWLLMVDSDTWVSDGGDLLQMISDADKAGATVVGAAVPRRGNTEKLAGTLMVYSAPKDFEMVSYTPAAIMNGGIAPGERSGTFTAVDALATACIAINLRHVEFMDEPYYRFTKDESEDIDFCRRVREMRGGWMKIDAVGKPSADGVVTEWKGLIVVDKRVRAFHLNRPTILAGLGG